MKFSLTEVEKKLLWNGAVRRNAIVSGAMTGERFDQATVTYTRADGTIDWAGLIAFITAIMPLIEQLITLLTG